MGHELVGNEVLDVVAAHVQAFARVDAIHAALSVEDEVPKPLFVSRQTAAALGSEELVGYVGHVGVARLQKQRQMPQAKPAQYPRIPPKVIDPRRLQQHVIFVQGIGRILESVLGKSINHFLAVAPDPRTQEFVRHVYVKMLQHALRLRLLRLHQPPVNRIGRSIHRQPFQLLDMAYRLLQLIASPKRHLEVVDRIPRPRHHMRKKRLLFHPLLPLLYLRQQPQQPIKLVRRRGVLKTPRQPPRIHQKILRQLHEREDKDAGAVPHASFVFEVRLRIVWPPCPRIGSVGREKTSLLDALQG